MKTFVHLDAGGHIVGLSSAPDHVEAGDDPQIKEVHVPDGVRISAYSHSYINGMLVPVPSRTPGLPGYNDRRRDAYPPMTDYLDGLAKSLSPDPVLAAEGAAQIAAYAAACLAVKAAYPKE